MDTPETLAADLLKAAGEAIAATQAVVRKGALNIKAQAKQNVQASAPLHSAHAAQAITYDTKFSGTNFEAEIGYDKDKGKSAGKRTGPGGLGNILEYGSATSAPHRDLGRALDVEEPLFEIALGAAIEKLL